MMDSRGGPQNSHSAAAIRDYGIMDMPEVATLQSALMSGAVNINIAGSRSAFCCAAGGGHSKKEEKGRGKGPLIISRPSIII